MRSFYYLVLLYFALFFTSTALPQIAEITRLPVQNPEQSIKESAPIWISENEIMIFYVSPTLDTIYSTKSNDRGITWQEQKFEFKIDSLLHTQELIYPAVLKTKTGRLILAWTVIGEGINLSYSDNAGNSWSQPEIIIGTGVIA
ncbi:MAG: sialidase family protein, partial [Ignavibacteriaceae bacterium]